MKNKEGRGKSSALVSVGRQWLVGVMLDHSIPSLALLLRELAIWAEAAAAPASTGARGGRPTHASASTRACSFPSNNNTTSQTLFLPTTPAWNITVRRMLCNMCVTCKRTEMN